MNGRPDAIRAAKLFLTKTGPESLCISFDGERKRCKLALSAQKILRFRSVFLSFVVLQKLRKHCDVRCGLHHRDGAGNNTGIVSPFDHQLLIGVVLVVNGVLFEGDRSGGFERNLEVDRHARGDAAEDAAVVVGLGFDLTIF